MSHPAGPHRRPTPRTRATPCRGAAADRLPQFDGRQLRGNHLDAMPCGRTVGDPGGQRRLKLGRADDQRIAGAVGSATASKNKSVGTGGFPGLDGAGLLARAAWPEKGTHLASGGRSPPPGSADCSGLGRRPGRANWLLLALAAARRYCRRRYCRRRDSGGWLPPACARCGAGQAGFALAADLFENGVDLAREMRGGGSGSCNLSRGRSKSDKRAGTIRPRFQPLRK